MTLHRASAYLTGGESLGTELILSVVFEQHPEHQAALGTILVEEVRADCFDSDVLAVIDLHLLHKLLKCPS